MAATVLAGFLGARSNTQAPVVAEFRQWTEAALRRAASVPSRADHEIPHNTEPDAVTAPTVPDPFQLARPAPTPTEDEVTAAPPGAPEPQRSWQPVWRPFRSEISANGFAEHLARLTRQDYRVRRVRAWAYRVEFAYDQDAERTETLRQIEEKTGLSVAGHGP